MSNHPESERLIELIAERLPGDKPAIQRLAAAAGLPPHSETSIVRKWQRGETRPSTDYLIPMLIRAGLLHDDAARIPLRDYGELKMGNRLL
jgi:hypothetical protein